MPCYHPLKGYYSRDVNKTGKRSLVFDSAKALLPVSVSVPCGRCIGCRLDRSLMWALRCVHEASLYDSNCFITLTFDDKHLSDHRSLCVKDFQDFMKRFRKFVSPQRIRFFHCGEYGAKFSRPHHHACIFGYDFPDKKLLRSLPSGDLYTSDILSSLWEYGFHTIGKVTFESAAYVARYVLKKWSKDNLKGADLYDAMCALNDKDAALKYYGGLHPEYITMSRRPGIGQFWYDKFSSDVYPHGYCVLPSGVKVRPPKYYDSKFELDNSWSFAKLKGSRLLAGQEDSDNSPVRLAVREEVQLARSNQLKRSFEYES